MITLDAEVLILIKCVLRQTLAGKGYYHFVDVAEKSGIHRTTASTLMKTDYFDVDARISISTIDKLCRAFHIQVSDIIVYEPNDVIE